MASNSKIRSACDTCHRMKVRCTGDVPCEGCLNSGNLCFYSYSGRLGRPKGTKNRKRKGSDEQDSSEDKTDTEPDAKRQSPARQLPPRSNDHFTHRQGSSLSNSSTFPMEETFPTTLSSTNPPLLDTMFENNNPGFPFNNVKPPQNQHIFDPAGFDFPDMFPVDGDGVNFLDPAFKEPFDMQEQPIHPLLPTPSTTSPHTPTCNDLTSKQTTTQQQNHKQNAAKADCLSHNMFPTGQAGCSCFQQNADLLCSFKLAESAGSQNSCQVDTVLHSTEEALKPWQSLVECPNCAYNSDQEVLQIAFMTIRMLLLRLQPLVPSCSVPIGGKRGSAEGKSQQPEEADNPWPTYNTRMRLGSFEVDEHDNKTVIQVLLLSTIHKIKAMMVRFKEMVDRKQKLLQPKGAGQGQKKARSLLAEQGHAASNLDHVQHMLQSLGSFLQTLERSLEREQSERNGPGK